MNPLLNFGIPLGFGFMNASWVGSPVLDDANARAEFIQVLVGAMEAGVRLFDTSDIYAPSWDSMGHNEVLLREAVAAWQGTPEEKAQLILATKGGISRGPGEIWGRNANYEYLSTRVEASLQNLGVVEIPLWQHHRLDYHLTLAEQLANLAKLQKNAPIRHFGVSNYSADQLLQALDVLGGPGDGGLVSVQNQLNPIYRQQLDVIEVCESHGLAFLPWSPMKGVRPSDAGTPAYELFAGVAKKLGVSTFAVAQAWLRSLSPNIIPLPGVTKVQSVADAIGAVRLILGQDELSELLKLPESLPLDAELISDQPKAVID